MVWPKLLSGRTTVLTLMFGSFASKAATRSSQGLPKLEPELFHWFGPESVIVTLSPDAPDPPEPHRQRRPLSRLPDRCPVPRRGAWMLLELFSSLCLSRRC